MRSNIRAEPLPYMNLVIFSMKSNIPWEDLYKEDKDLYDKDMKNLAEKGIIVEEYMRIEMIKAAAAANPNNMVSQLIKDVEHPCDETHRFLPAGWEV
jgi:hypothetical protein